MVISLENGHLKVIPDERCQVAWICEPSSGLSEGYGEV